MAVTKKLAKRDFYEIILIFFRETGGLIVVRSKEKVYQASIL